MTLIRVQQYLIEPFRAHAVTACLLGQRGRGLPPYGRVSCCRPVWGSQRCGSPRWFLWCLLCCSQGCCGCSDSCAGRSAAYM
jgi:hypothetical protein